MGIRSRSNGHKVFLPAAAAHRAESLASARGRALAGIAETVLPRLSGKEYAEFLVQVLALSEQDYDAMGKLAVELNRWAMERYPRVAALKRPCDLSDIAMAIDADRDSFTGIGDTGFGKTTEGAETAGVEVVEERRTPNAETGTSKGSGAPTFVAAMLAMMLGGAFR